MAEHNYSADSIDFLKGLETVRKRPRNVHTEQ